MLSRGTPRIQRMIVRLLRRLLPKQSPDRLGNSIHPNKDIIISLLELAGAPFWGSKQEEEEERKARLLQRTRKEEGEAKGSMEGTGEVKGEEEDVDSWRDGHVAVSMASETVLLLRILLDGTWRVPLTTALNNALLRIPDIVQVLKYDDTSGSPPPSSVPAVLLFLPSAVVVSILTIRLLYRRRYGAR